MVLYSIWMELKRTNVQNLTQIPAALVPVGPGETYPGGNKEGCRIFGLVKSNIMRTSTITINVGLDEGKVPESISWSASESTAEAVRDAKAVILSFWDGRDRSALRMDLWTKEMRVDEMADFYFQTFMTMADTYKRANTNQEVTNFIKDFAFQFGEKVGLLKRKEQ